MDLHAEIGAAGTEPFGVDGERHAVFLHVRDLSDR